MIKVSSWRQINLTLLNAKHKTWYKEETSHITYIHICSQKLQKPLTHFLETQIILESLQGFQQNPPETRESPWSRLLKIRQKKVPLFSVTCQKKFWVSRSAKLFFCNFFRSRKQNSLFKPISSIYTLVKDICVCIRNKPLPWFSIRGNDEIYRVSRTKIFKVKRCLYNIALKFIFCEFWEKSFFFRKWAYFCSHHV